MRLLFAFFTAAVVFAGCATAGENNFDPTLDDAGTAPDQEPSTRRDAGKGDAGRVVPQDASPGNTKDGAVDLPDAEPDAIADAAPDAVRDAAPDATPDASPDASADGGSCATVAPSNACGLAPQCGCAANQTCAITNLTTGAVSCVAAGARPQGSACTANTQCAPGLACVDEACRPYCNGTCTAPGTGRCYQATNPPAHNKVCAINCDLHNPAPACNGNGCHWYNGAFSDCGAAGTKVQDTPCGDHAECLPGYVCVDSGSLLGRVCEKWCRLGQADCPAGRPCIDHFGASAPVINGSRYGSCY